MGLVQIPVSAGRFILVLFSGPLRPETPRNLRIALISFISTRVLIMGNVLALCISTLGFTIVLYV